MWKVDIEVLAYAIGMGKGIGETRFSLFVGKRREALAFEHHHPSQQHP